MRPCQLCGAQSWGPILANQEVLARMREFADMQSINPEEYVRCDHCRSLATKELVSAPEPATAVPEEAPPMLSAILASVRQTMPVPETRAERLARCLLQGGYSGDARDVASFVRELEHELDGESETPKTKAYYFGPAYLYLRMDHFKRLLTQAVAYVRWHETDDAVSICKRLMTKMEHDFNE